MKNKVPIRVIDKAIEPHKMARGAGQHVSFFIGWEAHLIFLTSNQARTLEVWRFLGVLDDMCARSAPIRPMTSYKLPGGTEVERVYDFSAGWTETPDQPYVSVTTHVVSAIADGFTACSGAWASANF